MVPALNEEDNLANTINEIQEGLRGKIKNYEIFIFDDGSTDQTGKIADQLAKDSSKIKVIHNRPNKGLGNCYREGLRMAKFEYYMYIPGDNQFPKKALIALVNRIGELDIIIPYVTNMHIRPLPRQILSSTFTIIINLAFGLHIKYYNGTVIHRTDILRRVRSTTNGFAYQAEILIQLLKSGASFVEVGYEMVERQIGLTSAFKLKNVKSVFQTIGLLFWEIQVLRKFPVRSEIKEFLTTST